MVNAVVHAAVSRQSVEISTKKMGFFAAVWPPRRGNRDRLRGERAWALPSAIGIAALLLRLYGLGDKPLWLDEVASLRRATASLPALVSDSLHNTHYPTYFLLLWLVAKIGMSQWLIRLPSAVFGGLSAALVCVIGSNVADRRSGAAAGLLLAVSPFAVQFGQEARSYALVSCLILIALWGLVQLARQPAAAALPLTGNRALRGPWIAYILGTAAALDVLNVAIPWFAAANLGALAIAPAAAAGRRGFWRNWAAAQGLILALWAPLLILVWVSRNGAVLEGAEWAPAGTFRTIWSILAPVYLLRISSFITFDLMPAPVPGLAIAIVAAAAAGAWRLRREPTVLRVLANATLVLPIGLFLVSLAVPVLVPRYFAWGAAPFFIFAGVGLGQFAGARFAAVSAALGAIGLINLAPYYSYETKPRWDLAAVKLAALARPGDVVLLNSYYAYSVLSVFAARAGLDEHRVKLSWEPADAARVAPGRDVWAVYGRTGQAARQPAGEYQKSLSALGRPAEETSIGRYIVVWHFAEPNGPDPAVLGPPPRDGGDLSLHDPKPR
jgi:mannosyltransferase